MKESVGMKKILFTENAPSFDLSIPQGTKYGNRVFVSGMFGVDPATLNPPAGFEEEAALAMDHFMAVADAGGMGPNDILKCNIYLKDINKLTSFDKVYASYFSNGNFPARYVFEMPSLLGPYEVAVEGFGHSADAWDTIKREVIRTDRAARRTLRRCRE